MENFVKQYVKTYKTVNKLIAENITKEEILEFLNSGECAKVIYNGDINV